MYKLYFKRLLDIILSFSCIIIILPLYIIIGIIIYIQDRKTPLFIQKRIGLNEKTFEVLKFRSMPINTTNVESSYISKIKITPFGKFIRRTNIDELPQLFNILKGDMSIVGPRPSLFSQLELIKLRRINDVYSCKPGLTGLAQVNSFDNMPDVTKVYWDGLYVKNVSFLNDIKIILRTFIYLTKKPPIY